MISGGRSPVAERRVTLRIGADGGFSAETIRDWRLDGLLT